MEAFFWEKKQSSADFDNFSKFKIFLISARTFGN